MGAGPRFKKPPVAEVALAVEFGELATLRTVQLALLWEYFQQDYPTTEEHTPLPPISELLKMPAGPRVELALVAEESSPRLWFIDKPGSKLIQIQRNRVGFNWRRFPSEVDYPSFDVVLANFQTIAETLQTFVQERLGSLLQPTHCEVTYVDHVEVGGERGIRSAGDLGRLLDFWRPEGPVPSLGVPEEAGCFVRYPLGAAGPRGGRLSLQIQPGIRRSDGIQLLVMQTTAQMGLKSNTWDSVWTDLNIAHKAATRMFLEVTRSEMQKLWGREDL